MSTNPPSDHDRPFEVALLGELLAVQKELSGTGAGRPKVRGLPRHWASADGDHRRARTWGLTAAALLIIAAGSAIGTGIVENSGGKPPTNTLDVAYLSSAALGRAPENSVEYVTTVTTEGGKTEKDIVWRHDGMLRSEVLNGNGVALRQLALSMSGVGSACRVAGKVVTGASRSWTAIGSTTEHAKPAALNDVGTDIQKALASGELKVVGNTTLHGQKVIELKGTMQMGALPGMAPGPLAACVAAPAMAKALAHAAAKVHQSKTSASATAVPAGATGSSGPTTTGNSGAPVTGSASGGGPTTIVCPGAPGGPPTGPSGSSGGTGNSGTGNSGTSGSTGDTGQHSATGAVVEEGAGNTGSSGGTGSAVAGNSGSSASKQVVTFFGQASTFSCHGQVVAGPNVQVTLWVNPQTFLPVQMTTTLPGGHQTTTSSFAFLPLRPANIAALQVVVPNGYKFVQKPTAAATAKKQK